ncbi:MAG: cytochrome ubiquinol oxidase subunit I [Kineosporiaceae bacterium]
MEALDLARLQFGITTVYHFLFVPLTIGLAPLVAIMQTLWVRTGDERWLRLTKFFGKLFLINFAIGVVTGIVQEFQFGMNWSEYSRFVGDVFGAPLAIEALAAFFLESVFIGLWIFGWGKLSKGVHLACIWLVAIGVNLSAYFILAANSWMQHPVGARFNPETGRAELTDFWAVLTNNTTLYGAFPHTIAASFLTAGTFVAAIAAWWMIRSRRADEVAGRTGPGGDAGMYRSGMRLGLAAVLVSGVALFVTGDVSAKLMFDQQPMKMASAEALCETEDGAGFSVLAIGDLDAQDCDDVWSLSVPGLTSFLADGDFGATIPGIDDLQQQSEERYGEGVDYVPHLAITYWSFRLMMGFGVFSALLAFAGLWLTRGGRTTGSRWLERLALVSIPMPFLAGVMGWIFTEMGRQPWVVAPNPTGVDGVWMFVADGVSPNGAWMVATSLVVFTLLYGVLAVVWFGVMRRYAMEGAPAAQPADVPGGDSSQDRPDGGPDSGDSGDRPLAFAY